MVLSPSRRTRASRSGAIAFTGIQSFLGRALLARIADDPSYAGVPLVLLDAVKPDEPTPNARFYKVNLTAPLADVRVAELLKKEAVRTVVHLALLSAPSADTEAAHEQEAIGTLYVLNACQEAGVERLIVAGTTLSYGARASNPSVLVEGSALHGGTRFPFVRDKVEVEELLADFRKRNPATCVTVLRSCLCVGPTIENLATRILSAAPVLRILGADPLLQLVHEQDLIAAFLRALGGRFDGPFNVVGNRVWPLSALLRVARRASLALPAAVAYPLARARWLAGAGPAPAAYLDYLRYPFVADGSRAAAELGFRPRYSTREAIESFATRRRRLGLGRRGEHGDGN